MLKCSHMVWDEFFQANAMAVCYGTEISLGMTAHVPCPCILRSADNSCYALIHVDDILVVGKRDFVMNRLVKCLKEKYEVSVQTMGKVGDEIQFLKRKMVLHHDGRLSIQTHYKH